MLKTPHIGYAMDSKKVANKFQQCLRFSKNGMSRQWDNTRECWKFYSGDTMNYEDKVQFNTVAGAKKRAMVRFNKVMPYVDGVCGFMQQNRRNIKYIARSESSLKQQAYSKYMNAVSNYVRDQSGAAYLEGEQDLDMLVDGYGLVETDISYVQGNSTNCPNGEIIKARIDPMTSFWDTSAKRKNLMDSRWIGYWQDYALDDALALFPNSTEEDFQTADVRDNETYYYDPYGGRYDKISFNDSVEWASQTEKKVRVYNFQWFEYETFYQADNPVYTFQNPEAQAHALAQMTALQKEEGFGDMFAFDPKARILTFDTKTKSQLVAIFGKFITPVAFKRKIYYTAVVSGKHVFTWFKSVSQTNFSILAKTGTFDPIRKIWIGMVNNMMQPQIYYNKALTELMFTIASNSKGGVIVEKSAVEDIQEFEQKYASTTGVVVVEDGAIGKVMPKGQSIPTTGLEGIVTLSDTSIADASGVDKAFLGGGVEKVESGILYRRRIRQVISTIAKYFDSISLYQKTDGRNMLDFMRIWAENNDGMEFEVLEDDGSHSTALIAADKFMAEYGVVIQESMETAEDKQETAELISTIGDKVAATNPQAAQVIWARAINYLNIDSSDKKAIAEALRPSEPVDPNYVKQLEEQLKLLSSETNQADIKAKMARAEKDLASIEQIRADVELKAASTVKTLEEAQQKDVETSIMKSSPQPIVNI